MDRFRPHPWLDRVGDRQATTRKAADRLHRADAETGQHPPPRRAQPLGFPRPPARRLPMSRWIPWIR
ncbi:MAG: hypothetical protein DWQ36_18730 [Acidobacteria bacterium]|nr:MAG: hypothetical protein DWQ36_18730 [Acidobacteriota bacterium]